MNKKHSKLITALPVIAGLALGATAYADNIDSVFNTREGDFMFVTDYMHKTNRNEITDINARIKGGDSRKGVKPTIYAIAPQEAIKREITFLNSTRGKQFYSQEERLDLIGRYQNFLKELDKEKINPDKKSLEALSLAASDGIINPEELNNVKDNIYAIVKEGYDSIKGNYTVLYMTELTSAKTPSQYETKINELERQLAEISKSQVGNNKESAPILPEPPIPTQPQTQIQPQPIKEVPKQETPKQERDYRSFYLLTQGTFNNALDAYGADVGARINPFKNADIGFGANLDIGFGLDKQTDSYTAKLSAGRSANGAKTDTGKFSIGGSLEAQLGPFIVGGGIDYKLWTANTVEQILSQSGNVVKSNQNSVPNRQVFGKVYGGIEFPLGDNFKLGFIGGYNGKDNLYFGLRGGFKIK